MCGRYYLERTSIDFQRLVKRICENQELPEFKDGEVFPSDNCLVLVNKENSVYASAKQWGYKKDKVYINARYENLPYTKLFAPLKNNPCIIVANGYYEWDKNKEKHYFSPKLGLYYLAGIYTDDHFVILTTESNNDIHPRMPLIIPTNKVKHYLGVK